MKKKRIRQVGDVFDYKGVSLRCEIRKEGDCSCCHFFDAEDEDCFVDDTANECTPKHRGDNHFVWFVLQADDSSDNEAVDTLASQAIPQLDPKYALLTLIGEMEGKLEELRDSLATHAKACVSSHERKLL